MAIEDPFVRGGPQPTIPDDLVSLLVDEAMRSVASFTKLNQEVERIESLSRLPRRASFHEYKENGATTRALFMSVPIGAANSRVVSLTINEEIQGAKGAKLAINDFFALPHQNIVRKKPDQLSRSNGATTWTANKFSAPHMVLEADVVEVCKGLRYDLPEMSDRLVLKSPADAMESRENADAMLNYLSKLSFGTNIEIEAVKQRCIN